MKINERIILYCRIGVYHNMFFIRILYFIIYTHNTNDFVDDRNKYNNNYSYSKNDNGESKIFLELVMV